MQSRERIPWPGEPHELRMQRIAEAGGEDGDLSAIRGRGANISMSGSPRTSAFAGRCLMRPSATLQRPRSCSRSAHGSTRVSIMLPLSAPAVPSDGVSHVKRYQSLPEDHYPSILAVELQTERWVPAVLNGERLLTPAVRVLRLVGGAAAVACRPTAKPAALPAPLRLGCRTDRRTAAACSDHHPRRRRPRVDSRICWRHCAEVSRVMSFLSPRLVERGTTSVHRTAPPRLRATWRSRA